MHKTAAWPLALIYAALVIYASLYPFDGWRPVGIAPWTFLAAPVPRYWTGFDVAANLLGYGPLGFLLALSALRTSPRLPAVLLAALGGGLLSLVMESLQTYLPMRVASNVDLLLNLAGAWLGALMAFALERRAPSRAGAAFGSAGLPPIHAARWCCWPCGRWHCCFRPRCRWDWGRCWSGPRTHWPPGWLKRLSCNGCRCAISSWSRCCPARNCCA